MKSRQFTTSRFQNALKYVSALADFFLIDQYRSHTADTLSYMKRYHITFHPTKDVFLEFCTSKASWMDVNGKDWELKEVRANQHAKEVCHNTAAKRHYHAEQDQLQRL